MWPADQWEEVSGPTKLEPSMSALPRSCWVPGARLGSLQGHPACQGQAAPWAAQHCSRCPAFQQYPSPQQSTRRLNTFSIFTGLYFFEPSWDLPYTSTQPRHLHDLQNFQRLLILHKRWKVPTTQESCKMNRKTTKDFILWQMLLYMPQNNHAQHYLQSEITKPSVVF